MKNPKVYIILRMSFKLKYIEINILRFVRFYHHSMIFCILFKRHFHMRHRWKIQIGTLLIGSLVWEALDLIKFFSLQPSLDVTLIPLHCLCLSFIYCDTWELLHVLDITTMVFFYVGNSSQRNILMLVDLIPDGYVVHTLTKINT